MSLSAIALTALLTAQAPQALTSEHPPTRSLTSGVPSVGELHLRAPKAPRAARPPISWSPTPSKARRPPLVARGFVIYPMGENCKSGLSVARGTAAGEARPLSKMPSGHLEFTVARRVDGCPVAAPMRADDKIQ